MMEVLSQESINAAKEADQKTTLYTACNFEIVTETEKAVKIKMEGRDGLKPKTYYLWTSKANLQIKDNRVTAMVSWLLHNICATYGYGIK